MEEGSLTSPTLLGRLRLQPTDEVAWAEFVDRYGRKIHAWCRQRNLQQADAQDVTQIVLTKLAEKMRTFAYDPTKSFRGWLRTLTQHAWSDFVESRQRGGRASADPRTSECLQLLESPEGLVAALESAFDLEVWEEAQARVQLRVDPSSWEAFRLTSLEGLSGAEAALRLDRQVGAVFKAKNRVHKMLQEEVRKLEGNHS